MYPGLPKSFRRRKSVSIVGQATLGYHDAVREFKIQLLTSALVIHDGNRTHAARTLRLQRTYLLRLIRQLGIDLPRPTRVRASR